MDVEHLITLVQARRPIFDASDPLHRNRDAISAIWKEIATEMKWKDVDCKEKWKQVRSNFMREKKKLDALPSGSANVKTKKWVFYDAMTFITPSLAPRATSSNVPPPIKEMITELDTEDEGATLEDTDISRSVATASNVDAYEEESTSCGFKQPSSTTKKKTDYKKHRTELQNDVHVDEQIVGELQKMREHAVSRNEMESDPDRHFLLSLLPLMKQLSAMDNLDVKIEIQQAFRRKLAANQKCSYDYSSAPLQKPSKASRNVRETPSPYSYETPSPYKTPSPYATELTSAYGIELLQDAHEMTSAYRHGTTSGYGHTTAAYGHATASTCGRTTTSSYGHAATSSCTNNKQ